MDVAFAAAIDRVRPDSPVDRRGGGHSAATDRHGMRRLLSFGRSCRGPDPGPAVAGRRLDPSRGASVRGAVPAPRAPFAAIRYLPARQGPRAYAVMTGRPPPGRIG